MRSVGSALEARIFRPVFPSRDWIGLHFGQLTNVDCVKARYEIHDTLRVFVSVCRGMESDKQGAGIFWKR